MQVSYKWLKEYVDINLSPEELAERLTMVGLEVEAVDYPGEGLEKFLVGKITAVEEHPAADKLVVCEVDTGKAGTFRVTSGAPNIEVNRYVALAPPGTVLPSGEVIKEVNFRGLVSNGMLCSAEELQIPAEYQNVASEDGILILSGQQVPGQTLNKALGLDDAVLVFELTPNRGDCFGVINLAREVSTVSRAKLTLPKVQVEEQGYEIEERVKVDIEAPELCRRYAARLVTNVKIGPSPSWMQEHLRLAGVRPINNVVDVTNYVMLEMNQPLHAFDYDRLAQQRIVVRRARQGETIETIDHNQRELDEDMLVIADGERPVALAGIMGGADTEVTDGTKNILLESAYFDPICIRRTAKKIGLRSESSIRFEKGIELDGTVKAVNRAAQLMQQLGAGKVVPGVLDNFARPEPPLTLRLRPAKVNQVLGLSLKIRDIILILERIGFAVEEKNGILLVDIPSYRVDVTREIDLVEEVARIYGYDRIPTTLPVGGTTQGVKSSRQLLSEECKDILVASGFSEIITFGFINPQSLVRLGQPEKEVLECTIKVRNPLSEDQGIMRTSLLPGLLNTINTNVKRRLTDLAFFEIGNIFLVNQKEGEEGLPEERLNLAAAVTGKVFRGWQEQPLEYNFYFLKGVLEHLFSRLRLNNVDWQAVGNQSGFHPARTAKILLNNEEVGILGELHPEVLENYDLTERVVLCELDLEKIFQQGPVQMLYQPVPRFPSVSRDIALLVPERVMAAEVENLIKTVGGDLLKELSLFDVYKGEQVPDGYKSLAFTMSYQSTERTLTDEEVSLRHRLIQNALKKRLEVVIR